MSSSTQARLFALRSTLIALLAIGLALLGTTALAPVAAADPVGVPVTSSSPQGGVTAWGSNDYGQTTVPVAAQSGVTAIAAGGYHSLALKSDGSVIAWGESIYGQTNVPVAAQSGVTAIAAGGYHSLALKSDGSVIAWGYNNYGQATVPVAAQSGVTAIAAGGYHSLALKSDGSVIAWGYNGSGGSTVPVAAQSGVTAIAAGAYHSLALKSDGSVIAWGANYSGQATVPVAAQSGVTAIAAGYSHSLALKSDGSVIAWGDNGSGQATVPVAAQSGVTAIAAGISHSLALKSDGSVIAWGNNNYGVTTVPVAAQSGVTAIAAGYTHSLALTPIPVVFSAGAPPDGTYGSAYSYTFAAAQGTVPASNYTLTSGALPNGLTLNPTTGVLSGTPTSAGSFTFTVTATGSGGATASTAVSLTVAKAALTVTAKSYAATYGDPAPATGYTLTGLLGGDHLATTPSCSIATPHTAAGSYPITCTGADAGPNYTISYLAGQFTIDKALVTITANNQTITYGDPDPTFTATTTGLQPGDTLTTAPTCTVTGAHSNAGTYPITCTGADPGSNYAVAYVAGTLTVTKAPVTITGGSYSIVRGNPDPTFTATTTGLLGSDHLATPATCSVTGAHTAVGTYPVTCTGADAGGNYTIDYGDGQLSITAKPGVVTATDQTITYGDPDPTFTYTISGIDPGDLSTAPTCTVASAHTGVGTYPITCTGGVADGDTLSYVAGTLTVQPALVTITGGSASKTYGDPDPTLGYTTTGLIGGEHLTTNPTCAVTGAHDTAGTYPITCAGASAGPNYTIAYIAGTLTVSKAVVTVTAANQTKPAGGTDPTFSYTTSGLIGTDHLVTNPACTVTGPHNTAGTYPITCTSADPGPNYTIAYVAGTLTVTKAPVRLTATPLLFSLFRPTATLTQANTAATPIAGATITFSAGGKQLCTAITNTKGVAVCKTTFVLTLQLTAKYTGSNDDQPATDTSGILRT